jgi:hypothetical protein
MRFAQPYRIIAQNHAGTPTLGKDFKRLSLHYANFPAVHKPVCRPATSYCRLMVTNGCRIKPVFNPALSVMHINVNMRNCDKKCNHD